jgi:hypothetical protein
LFWAQICVTNTDGTGRLVDDPCQCIHGVCSEYSAGIYQCICDFGYTGALALAP